MPENADLAHKKDPTFLHTEGSKEMDLRKGNLRQRNHVLKPYSPEQPGGDLPSDAHFGLGAEGNCRTGEWLSSLGK